MPITLTLTDDQAIEVASQIGSILRNKTGHGGGTHHSPMATMIGDKARIIEWANAQPKGYTFNCMMVSQTLEVDVHHVTDVMKKLRKLGSVDMPQRGTYVKK